MEEQWWIAMCLSAHVPLLAKNVHLSAGVQIGGVLEPPQARPVIIEDDAFIGGMCGIFEGIVVRRRAVLAPGVILSKGTTIFDLVRGVEYTGEVPEDAVVVQGVRPAKGDYASRKGNWSYRALYCKISR